MSQKEMMKLVSGLSIIALTAGCSSSGGHAGHPSLSTYESVTEYLELPDNASDLERDIFNFKEYIPVAGDIMDAEESKREELAKEANLRYSVRYDKGKHYVRISGKKGAVTFLEDYVDSELVYAVWRSPMSGVTLNGEQYRVNVCKVFSPDKFRATVAGGLGDTKINARYEDGELVYGSESGILKIINGKIKRSSKRGQAIVAPVVVPAPVVDKAVQPVQADVAEKPVKQAVADGKAAAPKADKKVAEAPKATEPKEIWVFDIDFRDVIQAKQKTK